MDLVKNSFSQCVAWVTGFSDRVEKCCLTKLCKFNIEIKQQTASLFQLFAFGWGKSKGEPHKGRIKKRRKFNLNSYCCLLIVIVSVAVREWNGMAWIGVCCLPIELSMNLVSSQLWRSWRRCRWDQDKEAPGILSSSCCSRCCFWWQSKLQLPPPHTSN